MAPAVKLGLMAGSQNIYGGRTLEQRMAERRRRFIDAAIEIWGNEGWAAVTMRRVCSDAGLIDRYFYESFADRDALLVAAWDQIRDETIAAIVTNVREQRSSHPLAVLRSVISTFVANIEADRRRWRIQFAEHTGSAALEARRRAGLQHFTGLFISLAGPLLKPNVDETDLRLSTLMALGGFVVLISAWHEGVVDADAKRIVDQATDNGAVLVARFLDLSKWPDEQPKQDESGSSAKAAQRDTAKKSRKRKSA